MHKKEGLGALNYASPFVQGAWEWAWEGYYVLFGKQKSQRQSRYAWEQHALALVERSYTTVLRKRRFFDYFASGVHSGSLTTHFIGLGQYSVLFAGVVGVLLKALQLKRSGGPIFSFEKAFKKNSCLWEKAESVWSDPNLTEPDVPFWFVVPEWWLWGSATQS